MFYIMAKHLGRCLHPWEIIHHKNHNKTDNRIENLTLEMTNGHQQLTILENRVRNLEKQNRELREELNHAKKQNRMD